jgi:hypothetical protein
MNAYKVFRGKSGGKNLLGRPRSSWDYAAEWKSNK